MLTKKEGERQMRKNLLFIMLLGLMLLCAGCGKGKEKLNGSYKGESSREYILTFADDGTCSMDETLYSKWLEGGSETKSYTGIWRETDSGDKYEIILNDWSCTLYAELLESGDLLITAEESWWDTITSVKVE